MQTKTLAHKHYSGGNVNRLKHIVNAQYKVSGYQHLFTQPVYPQASHLDSDGYSRLFNDFILCTKGGFFFIIYFLSESERV